MLANRLGRKTTREVVELQTEGCLRVLAIGDSRNEKETGAKRKGGSWVDMGLT